MTPDNEEVQIRLARELAVQTALRNADVDRQLAESRMRLDKMNGSVDRFNHALEEQHLRMIAIEQTVDKRMSTMEAGFNEFVAISRALSEKGVSTRTFILGVLGLLIALLAPILIVLVNVPHV